MRPTVLFYGDSRAADWPAPNIEDVKFVNRGVPGQYSDSAHQRFGQVAASLQPTLMVLQLGVNDLTAIPYELSRKETIINHCQANIEAIVQAALSLKCKVVLTTIFPAGPTEFLWGGDDLSSLNEAVVQVNRFLETLAGPQVTLFDTVPLLAPEGVTQKTYALDLLHLNRAGYAVLNNALTPLLKSLLT